MGMTKAIQERVYIEGNLRAPNTRFICARYGNVLASRGSVVPLFLDQIAKGGPITITTPEMTRFLLTLDDFDVAGSKIDVSGRIEGCNISSPDPVTKITAAIGMRIYNTAAVNAQSPDPQGLPMPGPGRSGLSWAEGSCDNQPARTRLRSMDSMDGRRR